MNYSSNISKHKTFKTKRIVRYYRYYMGPARLY